MGKRCKPYPFACVLLAVLQCRSARCDCSAILEEGTQHTGNSFLSGCIDTSRSVLETSGDDGLSMPLQISEDIGGCLLVSERLLPLAFSDSPSCQSCPEACGLSMFLAAAGTRPDDITICSQSLLMLVRSFSFFDGAALEWAQDLYEALPSIVESQRRNCAAMRARSLQAVRFPPAPDRAPVASAQATNARGGWTSLEQVAILVAATPSMVPVYQPFVNLWRCYALRHGLAFIYETDDTEVSRPHTRAPNWMRWFAARKHIAFYKAILVVDPDEFVVPECWNMSVPAILGAWADAAAGQRIPDVAMRDFGQPQTLNNGMVLIRRSPRGLFFLDLLLEKAAWMQTIEKDQGAFDETVLEVLGFEAAARGGEGYDSECAALVFPNAKGNHEVGRYALCWWRVSERLAGPFGSRKSSMIRFADPRLADVNHVVGARGLQERALVHHFAGRSKDWDGMLESFGMSRRSTADCRRVHQHVDSMALERACSPGGPATVECEPPIVVC